MPCDSISRATVEFGLKTDRTLLMKALEELKMVPEMTGDYIRFGFGNRHLYDCKTGKFTLVGRDETQLEKQVGEIKRAYSAQVVQATARKFGWQMKSTGNLQWQAVRRAI